MYRLLLWQQVFFFCRSLGVERSTCLAYDRMLSTNS